MNSTKHKTATTPTIKKKQKQKTHKPRKAGSKCNYTALLRKTRDLTEQRYADWHVIYRLIPIYGDLDLNFLIFTILRSLILLLEVCTGIENTKGLDLFLSFSNGPKSLTMFIYRRIYDVICVQRAATEGSVYVHSLYYISRGPDSRCLHNMIFKISAIFKTTQQTTEIRF